MTEPTVLRALKAEVLKVTEANICRLQHGLPPIKIKLRSCMTCNILFESLGERFCRSCGKPKISTLMGKEIL